MIHGCDQSSDVAHGGEMTGYGKDATVCVALERTTDDALYDG